MFTNRTMNHTVCFALLGLFAFSASDATGQTYAKRRITRRHIHTNQTFGHVTLSDYDRSDRNLFNLTLESTSLGDDVGRMFGEGRENRLTLIIESFQSGDQNRGLSLWGQFIDNLADYDQPVDLDRIALYVARESSVADSDAAIFYGRQLAFIRDSMDLLVDYMDSIQRQRRQLALRSRLTDDAATTMDREIIRARSDWDVLAVREKAAEREYRDASGSDARYQRRIEAVLGGLYDEAERRIRYYPDDHRCDSTCRYHAYDGTRFVYVRDHRHGPGCGHALINGRWMIARAQSGPAPHVCDRNCDNHYYDDGRLIVLKDHHHGPNCGHRWDGTHWVLASYRTPSRGVQPTRVISTPAGVAPGHQCTSSCLNHHYDGTRVVVLDNHVHRKGCGHAFNGTHWIDIDRGGRGRP